MIKLALFTIFLILGSPAMAATQLYLDSPLINLSLPEIELNDPEIYRGNPCGNITGATSCFNDVPNKQIIVRYPLTITSSIPTGVVGNLNFAFIDESSMEFAEIELLQMDTPLTSPLEFNASMTQSYHIQFKIKYSGPNSHPEPKVRISFTLVEVSI